MLMMHKMWLLNFELFLVDDEINAELHLNEEFFHIIQDAVWLLVHLLIISVLFPNWKFCRANILLILVVIIIMFWILSLAISGIVVG